MRNADDSYRNNNTVSVGVFCYWEGSSALWLQV